VVQSLTPDVVGWVRTVCEAPSAEPDEIASALGIDLTDARRLGSQLICPPPAGADRFELVLDPATGVVTFAEAVLAPGPPLQSLEATFGTAELIPPGPHDVSRTMVFDRIWQSGAARSCSVLARLAGDAPDTGQDIVTSVILYLQPPRPASSGSPG
jgi:hypothetical protein